MSGSKLSFISVEAGFTNGEDETWVCTQITETEAKLILTIDRRKTVTLLKSNLNCYTVEKCYYRHGGQK